MLIHGPKCKGEVSPGFRPQCTKCGKRWGPWALIWSKDIRSETREEMTKRKLKEVMASKVERDKFEGMSGRIREYAPGAAIMADLLPKWRRQYRIAFVVGLICTMGALIWLWKVR